MSTGDKIAVELREQILKSPEVILEDRDVMRALVAANDRAMGPNVVDMRRLAMERLEQRLDRLEDTHQSVIAAAYENLSGMAAVHRAILCLLEADTLADFAARLAGECADALRVDHVSLLIEGPAPEGAAGPLPSFVAHGTCADLMRSLGTRPDRVVTLRELPGDPCRSDSDMPAGLRSEAVLRLDLGPAGPAAILRLASFESAQFRPGQGTDLLAFFGGVVGRSLRRWLA